MSRVLKLWAILVFGLLLGLQVQGQVEAAKAAYEPLIPSLKVIEREGYQEIVVRTKLAEYIFSGHGGVLQSVYLHFAPIWTKPVELIPDTETLLVGGQLERSYVKGAIFPFRLIINGTEELNYAFSSKRSAQGLEISFTAEVEGVKISKTFIMSENPYYTVDFELEIQNLTGSSIEFDEGVQLFLGRGVGRAKDAKSQMRQLPQLNGVGFVGEGLVFFLFLQEPLKDGSILPLVGEGAGHESDMGIEIKPLSLEPGRSKSYQFRLFAGREKYTLLADVGLGPLSPPGFFSQFLVAVVRLLNWLYELTGNYGWAIILFTLITRILLFPLTRQQFHAMVKLAELRPKIEKLQQRYPTLRRLKELHPNLSQEELLKRDRENRRTLQEKLMELYRQEKVNPLGGCLPIIIQFPILIVLWQAILYSAEMIHLSPGFLWMSDLSLRDPYYLIVALTAIAMILQSKTTPTLSASAQGPQQWAFMMLSIGIMILFLKDFPSGLWFYYFLTTLIQVVQQVFISWELGLLKRKRPVVELEASQAKEPAKR